MQYVTEKIAANPLYPNNPAKQMRLLAMLNAGFVKVYRTPADGIARYEITPAGLERWQKELSNR